MASKKLRKSFWRKTAAFVIIIIVVVIANITVQINYRLQELGCIVKTAYNEHKTKKYAVRSEKLWQKIQRSNYLLQKIQLFVPVFFVFFPPLFRRIPNSCCNRQFDLYFMIIFFCKKQNFFSLFSICAWYEIMKEKRNEFISLVFCLAIVDKLFASGCKNKNDIKTTKLTEKKSSNNNVFF